MGDELKEKFNADVELVAGSGGVYDVLIDGKEIYSKKKAGKFPDKGEVANLIKQQ